MSKQTNSITSLGERAALAISRANEAFKSAKETGGYGNALLMNYCELKAITEGLECLVADLSEDARQGFSATSARMNKHIEGLGNIDVPAFLAESVHRAICDLTAASTVIHQIEIGDTDHITAHEREQNNGPWCKPGFSIPERVTPADKLLRRPKVRETLDLMQSLIDARMDIRDEYFEPVDARILAGWLGNLAARLHADGQRKEPAASPQVTEPDNRTKAAMIRRCIDELPIIGEFYADSADTVNAGLLELRAIADDMDKRG